MFGKRVSEYLAFVAPVLLALAVVGLLRLALSLAGLPDSTVKWVATNLAGWGGALWMGVAAHRRRFGTYRHLLPAAFLAGTVFHGMAVIGILLAIAGWPNIYAAPEYGGGPATNPWVHLGAHLTVGMVAVTLIWWGAASLARLLASRVAPVPTALPAA